MEENKECILCEGKEMITCECIEYSGQLHNCPVCFGKGERPCPLCNDNYE